MTLPKITVITPTIGRPHLERNIQSIINQTYRGKIEHFIIADGKQWQAATESIIKSIKISNPLYDINFLVLPKPTKIWGSKIYSAIPFISTGEYILNLDDDNFIDSNHITSLFETIKTEPWVYCLRKVYHQNKYICHDKGESLGKLHPVAILPKWIQNFKQENLLADDGNHYHVDTNCYFLHREVALRTCQYWSLYPEKAGFNDRIFYKGLVNHYGWGTCSYNYSVNYEANPSQLDVFLRANEIMCQKYGDIMPWEKKNVN